MMWESRECPSYKKRYTPVDAKVRGGQLTEKKEDKKCTNETREKKKMSKQLATLTIW